MGIGGLRLAIDYGVTTTVAVLTWPDGRQMPLLFDGSAQLPSAVHAGLDGRLLTGTQAWQAAATTPEGFQPAPLRHIRNGIIELGSTKVDVLDAIAATLRRVADEGARLAGQAVPDVRLVVPAGWGPRRRTLLRNAAHRAGLPTPTLIEAPIAAAHHLLAIGTPIADGAHLLVCDYGAGFEATVLRHTGDSFDVLATIDDLDAGTLRIDRDLAAYLTEVITNAGIPSATPVALSAGDQYMIQAAARTATESLTHAPAVAVAMPPPHPPVVLTHTQLDAISRPVLEQAAATARQALDAATEAGAEHPAGVYWIGDGAQLPLTPTLLQGNTTLAPTELTQPRLAAARGATFTAGDAIVPVDTGPPPPPLRRAVALVIPGGASLGLLAHTYATATYNHGPGIGYDPYAYVLANWGELAMAAIFALLTCLAAATLIASTLPALARVPQPGITPDQNTAISTGLLAAVAIGLSIAGLYAISGSLYFGLPSGPFLRWALIPALPIAALATTTAVLATRLHRTPTGGWHTWLNYPTSSILFATAGMALIQTSMSVAGNSSTELLISGAGRLGALLLGIGATLAIVKPPLHRLIVGAPLAIVKPPLHRLIVGAPLATFTTAIVSWPATGTLAVIYIGAATAWWLRCLWHLLHNRDNPVVA